jgi:hypothetical protein
MIPSLLKYSLFYCICYRFEATSSESLFFLSAAMYKDNYAFHACVVTNSLFAALTIQGCTQRGKSKHFEHAVHRKANPELYKLSII